MAAIQSRFKAISGRTKIFYQNFQMMSEQLLIVDAVQLNDSNIELWAETHILAAGMQQLLTGNNCGINTHLD
ncbi:hypothetical protein [Virgibacillus sp. YIM 98842]|uniref:hypothetical protein n=1 Tax=Virgibacillus sp. YIM 98842 TaxID=2663533 RepID=UPI0013DA7A08|nr:hypothetical protein [Virgibacillus sp. YIM 98842]